MASESVSEWSESLAEFLLYYLCPSESSLPVSPALRTKIHNASKYAAKAYEFIPDNLQLIDSDYKVRGFVDYNNDADTIIVSFRGTYKADWKDFWGNFEILARRYPGGTGCKVHTGFDKCYNSVRWQMLRKVMAFSCEYPNAKVTVTGHSRGGAMGNLAAVELAEGGYDVDLITFGAPRVGNKQFAEYVDKTVNGLNLRVTNKNDYVTTLPGKFLGYRHAGQEIHYSHFDTCYKLPPKTDFMYVRPCLPDHKMANYANLH